MAQKAPELGSACHWAHAYGSCNLIRAQALIFAPQARSSLCYWPQHQGKEFCSSMDPPSAPQRAATLRTPCKAEPSPTVRKAISRGTEAGEAESQLRLDLHSLPVVSTVLSAFFYNPETPHFQNHRTPGWPRPAHNEPRGSGKQGRGRVSLQGLAGGAEPVARATRGQCLSL